MTKTFARPGRALLAYERMLARKPRSWPPTTHDAPTLWSRARQLCAEMIDFVRSAAALAQRWRIGRNERRDILMRLVPVEVLVRTLLLIEAATFLLTPEGQRLRAATPTREPPQTPPPVGVKKLTHKTTIEMPGWRTISALRPRIDPRVAEREERERREALERNAAVQETLKPQALPAYDKLSRFTLNAKTSSLAEGGGGVRAADGGGRPQSGRTASTSTHQTPPHGARAFSVLRWTHDISDIPPTPRPPRRCALISVFDEDSTFNLEGDLTPIHKHRATREEGPCAALARRIDALERVIANPAPVIRRLARQLAALPHDCLPEVFLGRVYSIDWWHGRPEAHNASALAVPLFRQLAETPPLRPPEPG